jgi:DNA-binding NtrC family response regulator
MSSEILNQSILIIDGDPDVLCFLTLLFEGRGIRVLRARSRAEAFEVLGRLFVPIDLVLANILLLKTSNRDFNRDIGTVRPGVSVLYMTAFQDSDIIRIEAIKPASNSALGTPDQRGLLDMVLSELERPLTRASAS